jgi:8-hydroxy-5-deazaflavin:NADPH oxidoreductase
LASEGVEVTIGSRSPERASEIVEQLLGSWPGRHLRMRGGGNEAAAGEETVVVATPWDSATPTVSSLASRLSGKVVVSMANALIRVGGEFQPLVPPRGSVAVAVAAAAPGALVAAAFHHLPARELGDLETPLEADVLVCADDRRATDATVALVSRVPGLRAVEAGSLSSAGAVEALTAVLLNVNVRYRTHASLRLTRVSGDRY